MSCASGSSSKHINHQSNIENLIGAVFESWKHKKDPYLNSIMQEYYLGDSEEHFPDGGTIWPTRPSSPPKLVNLIPSTKDHPFENQVLEALCKASDSLSWFNNNSIITIRLIYYSVDDISISAYVGMLVHSNVYKKYKIPPFGIVNIAML